MTQQTLSDTAVLSAIISAVTSIILFSLGLFGFWLKRQWERHAADNVLLADKKRETFKSLLDLHGKIFFDVNVGERLDAQELQHLYLTTITGVLIWSSDQVLSEYGLYAQELRGKDSSPLESREIHFAKAVLAFRREIGFKNKGITPEQVATIFKASWRTGTI